MKKKCLLICLVLISSITVGGTCSCSSKSSGPDLPANDNIQDLQSTQSPKTQTPAPSPVPSPKTDTDPVPTDGSDGVDVDLTVLSSTMVYSEVYNMMASPEDYIGKTVKMKGQYNFYHDEVTDNYYFTCIIQDATACCAQGIEFVLTDDYIYPDDYPKADEEICVSGVFDTYKEGEYTYCTLRNAKLL